MKKILERILVFVIGVPLILCVVMVMPWKNHLALSILVILVSGGGALEFNHILRKKNLPLSDPEAVILGALGPAAMTASVSFHIDAQLVPALVISGAAWLLISRVLASAERLEHYSSRIAAGLSVMIYPGFFMIWLVRMTLFPRAGMVIPVFLLTVLINDSLAWAAGMLFGQGNQGIVPASPNKSIAGFVVGLAASTGAGIAGALFIPDAFVPDYLPALPSGAVLGFLSGLAACLGDLGESCLKRSSGFKDSGFIMPGRGGILDSIDSIALAAPVFYAVYRILFVL
ncbi:MAG: phosphatidate cytidylyltransferase [Treponema sp.]|jgi:phosphatidate cytidylyltransferase|nr:phosphatidate cytidylyltransferase [Treponema sp.]